MGHVIGAGLGFHMKFSSFVHVHSLKVRQVKPCFYHF